MDQVLVADRDLIRHCKACEELNGCVYCIICYKISIECLWSYRKTFNGINSMYRLSVLHGRLLRVN